MIFRPGLVHAVDTNPKNLVNHLRVPLVPYWHRQKVRAIHDTIVGIDPERRQVITATHDPVPYDVLFIATGSTPRWDAVPGLDARRRGICEGYLARHTATELQSSAGPGRYLFASAPLDAPPEWSPRPAVGCECPLFESALLLDAALRRSRKRENAVITIITPADVIAEQAGSLGRQRLADMLGQREITVVTGARFQSVTDTQVTASTGSVPFDHMVWLPGMAGSAWLAQSRVANKWGWVPVTSHLRHPQWPDIYAIGDIVSRPWPKMGHSAMVQARIAVHHWAMQQLGKKNVRARPYQPQLLWVLENAPGQALFVLSNRYWNGDTEKVWNGRPPYWAKQLFQWSYIKLSGALPVMP